MASVGQSAALGLESGFRLAMDVHRQQREDERWNRQEQRQSMLDQRQLRLDQQQQEDRQRLIERQKDSDALAAQTQQIQMLRQQAQALADTPNADPLQREQVARALQGATQQQQALLTKLGGYDVNTVARNAQAGMQALQTNNLKFFQDNPGTFSQTLTLTGFAGQDYLPGGEAYQAVQDYQEGLQQGDEQKVIGALNVLGRRDLRKGVGTPGREGGTIEDKRFVGYLPDPNAPPDNPHVIPTVRVYVNNGKAPESGDEIRTRRAIRTGDPDAPASATGYYDAPLTRDRSTDPKDPVKSLPVSAINDIVGQHKQMVELMATPEAQQLLAADAASGWDAQRFLQSQGIRPTPLEVRDTKLGAGETLTREYVNKATGKVEETKTFTGGEKEPTTLFGLAQARAKAKGTDPVDEYGDMKRRTHVKGSGGDGDDDDDGLSTAQDRRIKAQINTLKEDADELDNKESRLVTTLNHKLDALKDVTDRKVKAEQRAKIMADHEKAIGLIDERRAELKAERAALQKRLGMSGGEKPAPPAPAGLPKGSKKIGTSGGKAVYEAPNGKRYIEG